ncbi:hypothetical protein ACIBCU_33960 [Streptomyces sp. NPDC051064]|uniref:hypothetical protein n=1 Tax=Streptomyces sp. NPDC051064 TaxID=3365641 RepID=UPI0037B5704E
MQGFTIGVLEGTVCRTTGVGGQGWGGRFCTGPADRVYGGSDMKLKLQLEAVKFTV